MVPQKLCNSRFQVTGILRIFMWWYSRTQRRRGDPIRSPSLWSGLEGMLWPLSLKGHPGWWGLRNTGVDWLGLAFFLLLWNLRWIAEGLLLLNFPQRSPDSRGSGIRRQRKKKTKQEILPLEWVKGGKKEEREGEAVLGSPDCTWIQIICYETRRKTEQTNPWKHGGSGKQ